MSEGAAGRESDPRRLLDTPHDLITEDIRAAFTESRYPYHPGHPYEQEYEAIIPTPRVSQCLCHAERLQNLGSLSQLPFEILDQIFDYVDFSEIYDVNKTFLTIAWSRTFASVTLNYSEGSRGCLDLIESTSKSQLEPQYPPIGSWVRQLTIETLAKEVRKEHGIEESYPWDIQTEEYSARVREATSAYYGTYLPQIERLLRQDCLPNLQIFDWRDQVSLTQSVFESLFLSSARDVLIQGANLHGDVTLESYLAANRFWPLRRLHLNIKMDRSRPRPDTTIALTTSIFRLTAPTLRHLAWKNYRQRARNAPFSLLRNGVLDLPSFSSLRVLNLLAITLADTSFLDATLGPDSRVRALRVGTNGGHEARIMLDFFAKRGTIESLEALVWSSSHVPLSFQTDFIRANVQLRKLMFESPLTEEVANNILTVLAKDFKNLKTLSLYWATAQIPRESLRLLSELTQLHELNISARSQMYLEREDCDWDVDHRELISWLSCLVNLRKLYFTRDTYNVRYGSPSDEESDPEDDIVDYYDSPVCFDNNWEKTLCDLLRTIHKDENEAWLQRTEFGIIHEKRMELEVKAYAAKIPTLHDVFLGRLYFEKEWYTDAAGSGQYSEWKMVDGSLVAEVPEDIQVKAVHSFGLGTEKY